MTPPNAEAVSAALTAFSDEISKVGSLHKDAMRAALAAAAPFIAASAWDEGALAVMGEHGIGRTDIANPYME